jgi:hypothetical protein
VRGEDRKTERDGLRLCYAVSGLEKNSKIALAGGLGTAQSYERCLPSYSLAGASGDGTEGRRAAARACAPARPARPASRWKHAGENKGRKQRKTKEENKGVRTLFSLFSVLTTLARAPVREVAPPKKVLTPLFSSDTFVFLAAEKGPDTFIFPQFTRLPRGQSLAEK